MHEKLSSLVITVINKLGNPGIFWSVVSAVSKQTHFILAL
jgi:hypothetical protein